MENYKEENLQADKRKITRLEKKIASWKDSYKSARETLNEQKDILEKQGLQGVEKFSEVESSLKSKESSLKSARDALQFWSDANSREGIDLDMYKELVEGTYIPLIQKHLKDFLKSEGIVSDLFNEEGNSETEKEPTELETQMTEEGVENTDSNNDSETKNVGMDAVTTELMDSMIHHQMNKSEPDKINLSDSNEESSSNHKRMVQSLTPVVPQQIQTRIINPISSISTRLTKAEQNFEGYKFYLLNKDIDGLSEEDKEEFFKNTQTPVFLIENDDYFLMNSDGSFIHFCLDKDGKKVRLEGVGSLIIDDSSKGSLINFGNFGYFGKIIFSFFFREKSCWEKIL